MTKMKRKPVAVLAHESSDDERSWLDTEAGLDARHLDTPSRECVVSVELTVRLDDLPFGYAPRLAGEAVAETMVQRAMVRFIFQSLQHQNARLLDGRQVSTPAHAVQWLIEQCAASLPSDVLNDMLQSIVA